MLLCAVKRRLALSVCLRESVVPASAELDLGDRGWPEVEGVGGGGEG
jgi:hypothetical protein